MPLPLSATVTRTLPPSPPRCSVVTVTAPAAPSIASTALRTRFSRMRRPGPQPLGHLAQEPRQRADLVWPLAAERDVEPLQIHASGGLRKVRERPRDPRGEPAT